MQNILLLSYTKNDTSFTGCEIAIINTPHQQCAYEIVSRDFKI